MGKRQNVFAKRIFSVLLLNIAWHLFLACCMSMSTRYISNFLAFQIDV